MKVKDLIELLKKHDLENLVVVRSYESGYDDVVNAIPIKIIENANSTRWYEGRHEVARPEDFDNATETVFIAGSNHIEDDD